MSHRSDKSRDRPDQKPLPPWALGLLIAAALFVLALILFQALGFGDDPVVGQILVPNAVRPVYRIFAAQKGRPAREPMFPD